VPIETTPLGFKKPDNNELAKFGAHVISLNAQRSQELIQALWDRTPAEASAEAEAARRMEAAREPSDMFIGEITYDTGGAVIAADVLWPDGTGGAYTGAPSVTFPDLIDSYAITYGTDTYTQPQVTRDADGNLTNRPPITITSS
jgi:hypothetical protein